MCKSLGFCENCSRFREMYCLYKERRFTGISDEPLHEVTSSVIPARFRVLSVPLLSSGKAGIQNVNYTRHMLVSSSTTYCRFL